MRFTVPQFIEHEAKVVGPLTFKQFLFVGLAAGLGFLFYFYLPFSLFLVSCFFLGTLALSLAFIKIGGRTLPVILVNLLKFSLTPKMYIWKKTEKKVEVFKKEAAKEIKEEKTSPLKIAEGSQLKKLSTQMETKSK